MRETTILFFTFCVFSLAISLTSAAYPSARWGSATWYYDSKLWLYGGYGYAEGSTVEGNLSDLWSYDPSTNQWRFEMGYTTAGQPSVSGDGSYSAKNTPGARRYPCSWIANNTLWLFGGINNGLANNYVWNYDPTIGQWRAVFLGTGQYVYPYEIGSRFSHSCVVSPNGKAVYVSGGTGYDSRNSITTSLNDLWYYSMQDNTWTFLSGNTTSNNSIAGTLSVGLPTSDELGYPSFGNRMTGWTDPDSSAVYFLNGRADSYSRNQILQYTANSTGRYWTLLCLGADWTDRRNAGTVASGSWLFGGYGTDSNGNLGSLADLYQRSGNDWKYVTGPVIRWTNSSYPVAPGTGDSTTYPGARIDAVMWEDSNGDLWLFGGSTVLGVEGNLIGGDLNDLWKYTVSTNIWTWIGGSQGLNQNGNYTNDPLPPVAPPVTSPIGQPINSPVSSNNATAPDSQNSTNNGLSDAAKIAIGVVVPAVVIGVGLLVLLLLLNKRKKKNKAKKAATTSVPLTPPPTDGKYETMQPNGTYSRIAGPDANPPVSPSTQTGDVPASDSRLIPYTAITLEKEIGEGSFGKVYVGKLRTTKVAIKVANTKMSQDEFIREANFQLAIPPHPNIVQLLGISIDGPQPLVVLEYCNEGSLDKLLFESEKMRTPAEQIALAEAIARGIDHLHQNNIVHRDLAVRNILLHKGEPKISDFGMSRKLKEVSQVGKTAATIGPLRWMAPEALGKQVYSAKSDVWSFGMILFEIVAHEEPHANEDLISVAIKIRDEGYVPVIPDDCPPVLREVMQKCWNKDPDLRPDMSTICAVLERRRPTELVGKTIVLDFKLKTVALINPICAPVDLRKSTLQWR